MVKSIGIKKLKTAIFISGNGSNMKNLIRFSKTKYSPIVVDFVLSNIDVFKCKLYSFRI